MRSCLDSCCCCCCSDDCCCPASGGDKRKHPAIRYKRVDGAKETLTVEPQDIKKVPLDKIFTYQQPLPTFDAHMHPLLDQRTVVSTQPRSMTTKLVGVPSITISTADGDHSSSSSSSSKSLMEKSCAGSDFVILDAKEAASTLQFSLYFDVQRCVLSVHLQQATNLMIKTRMGMCRTDPFVVLFLQPQKEQVFESRIVKRSVDPYFDDHFDFTALHLADLKRQSLIFRIYNHDRYGHHNVLL